MLRGLGDHCCGDPRGCHAQSIRISWYAVQMRWSRPSTNCASVSMMTLYDIFRVASFKEFELVLEQWGSLLKKRRRPYFAGNRQAG